MRLLRDSVGLRLVFIDLLKLLKLGSVLAQHDDECGRLLSHFRFLPVKATSLNERNALLVAFRAL